MKVIRKIIQIDEDKCDGCGQCIPSCAEGALKIVEGKARVVGDKYCDGLGACLGECPNDALHIVEREAEEFDEAAVEHFLSEKEKSMNPPGETLPCGCPSGTIQVLGSTGSICEKANAPKQMEGSGISQLTHWPIQIRLVPANAPFLKQADLLVLADCSAVAFPGLHQDLLKGKVVLMGCPKFDEVELYIRKFSEIFTVSDIRSITTVVMEVPCCAGMPTLVKKGMNLSGKNIPMKEITVSVRGQVIKSIEA
jgi:Pyruvate/2-oxoacid:ferredoxin oxidoreductase delta subunit